MESAFISIGSNLGDRVANCKKAVELLQESALVKARSSFYETLPWGELDQPKFVNIAVEIETELSPSKLLVFLKSIEINMGRGGGGGGGEGGKRWPPRVIDLDIIFYGNVVMDDDALTLPHPLMSERAFVLVPLAQIAPDLVHPVLNKSVTELLARLDMAGDAVKLLE